METLLTYENIVLKPNLSLVTTRSECDTSITFCDVKFKLPVVPANMPSVINFELASWMAKNGYFYILHRYYDYDEIFNWIKTNQDHLISISVGVKESDRQFIEKLKSANLRVDFITIDIAMGYSIVIPPMIQFIKSKLSTKVIAGNISGDKKSLEYISNAGADGAKVGLSYGAACSTYKKTGFGTPMFSAAREVSNFQGDIPIILDGGVRCNGDITKALVGGSISPVLSHPGSGKIPMIMAGSLFAACEDAPGQDVFQYFGKEPDAVLKLTGKKYYGNASLTNKKNSGQETKHIEGFDIIVPYNGMTYEEKLVEIKQDLQSSISYAGGKDLYALSHVKWGIV